MNTSLLLFMTLLSHRICFILEVVFTHAAEYLSNQIFTCLSQVAGVKSSNNSSFRTTSHYFAIPESSNFVIKTIFVIAKIS